MRWIWLFGFVLFAGPNGQPIWIEPSQVVAIAPCLPRPNDSCAPGAHAQIITLGGNIYVAETLPDVLAKLADTTPKPKGK